MPLNKIKRTFGEIDGIKCSIVEKGISEERMGFLKELLEHNGFGVKISEEINADNIKSFTIGVTDILFNPVYSVYERTLKSIDGFKVTPAYWNQQTTVFDPRYWLMKRMKTIRKA
ncbi:MAG: hypothetical protein HGB12_10950 [Bacteroidetes bacterium]|nr:hypothetical protein [Bacteroidota bacterium]